jgi:hypothetical protein
MTESGGDGDDETTATTATDDGVTARYYEAGGERVVVFERDGQRAALAQNSEGYAMVTVRHAPDGDELERYYGFDMALDHAAELLDVGVADLPVPERASDMGM